ncbi:MAG: SpoIIE family protein phosphatase [Bacteroidia bacterium]
MSLVTNTILERINSLIVVVNSEGKIEYVSPSAKRILGFEPDDLLGEGWWNLTRDDKKERRKIRELIKTQIAQKVLLETIPQERMLKTANGGNKWILWNTSKGLFNKLVAIGHDITDRKNAELNFLLKHKLLEQQNLEILASIRYARRIQESILPDKNKIVSAFSDAFVLYQPKDVVSGDFYFFHQRGSKTFMIAVDCTGHGVPGALMTMLANSILKEVIVTRGIEEPAEILYAIDRELYIELNKDDGRDISRDGMDVAVTVTDSETKMLQYAGAFRPMLLVRGQEIIEFEANRFPIGFYGDTEKVFTSQEFQLEEGDAFYLFTDGFCDQFGGEQKKKFNRKRFKELLLSVQSMNFSEQEAFLQYALLNWRQDEPQVDDILVVGMKV